MDKFYMSVEDDMGKCLICLSDATDEIEPFGLRGRKSIFRVDCTQCGLFTITLQDKDAIMNHPQKIEFSREIISKYIKNHTNRENPLLLTTALIEKIINGENNENQ